MIDLDTGGSRAVALSLFVAFELVALGHSLYYVVILGAPVETGIQSGLLLAVLAPVAAIAFTAVAGTGGRDRCPPIPRR